MEQSLKARLIGAAVLVAVAVILVPELLTGRGPGDGAPASGESPGSRTFTIEIGESGARPAVEAPVAAAPAAAGNARAEDAGAARDSATGAATPPAVQQAPRPAAPTEPPAGGAAAPSPAVSAPAATEARVAQPELPAPQPLDAPAGAGWMVQVGAFGTAQAARSLVQDLEASGLAASVSPVARGGRTLHRVRVGPVPDRAEAEQLAKRLAARGLPATVVAGD